MKFFSSLLHFTCLTTLFFMLPLQSSQQSNMLHEPLTRSALEIEKKENHRPTKTCCNDSCCEKGMKIFACLFWAGIFGGGAYGLYYENTHPRPPAPVPFRPSTFCQPPQNTQSNFNLTGQPWTFQASNHMTGITAQGDSYCSFNGVATDAINAVVQNSDPLFSKDSTICVTTQDPDTSCTPYATTNKLTTQTSFPHQHLYESDVVKLKREQAKKLSTLALLQETNQKQNKNTRNAFKRLNQTQNKSLRKGR